MERKKIVHALDTPYSAVEWPHLSQDDQDTILELLCHLLTPLSVHRKTFVAPSKGKRKRAQKAADQDTSNPAPPVPELAAHVDVGLSQISRTLQAMSATASKPTPPQGKDASSKPEAGSSSGADANNPYTIVFVARSGQPSAFHSHFPQMVALAGRSQPADRVVRLVGFSRTCEERLTTALGIPRVSSIALREGAPQAKGLVDFVRKHVAPVEISWLREAQSAAFLETKIAAVPTKVGVKKVRLE